MVTSTSSFSGRLGVRGRLLLAFFGNSAFAILAVATAMYAFFEAGDALERITEDRVPATVASLQLARQAERMAAAAPSLLTINTAKEHEKISAQISVDLKQLDALVEVLRVRDVNPSLLNLIRNSVQRLNKNLTTVDALVINSLVLIEQKKKLLGKLRFTDISSRRLLAPGILVMDAKVAELRQSLKNQTGNAAKKSPIEAGGVAKTIVSNAPLHQLQIEVSSINDMLIKAASVNSEPDLELMRIPLRRSLEAMEKYLADTTPFLRKRLGKRLKQFRRYVDGAGSIIAAREKELRHFALIRVLLDKNITVSSHLNVAVDSLVAGSLEEIRKANLKALSVQKTSIIIMITVVALSLLSSILIVWLYVGRNLIARLTALSDSMLAIAGGNLRAPLPAPGGNDEITRMAVALTGFRDTAIEVEESNLRDIEEARRRLVDAIENSSEGFAFYDPENRLVICNNRYKELLYPGADVEIEPGMAFETIIRTSAENGYIVDAEGRIDEWIAERIALHQNPGEPRVQQRGDGRWILVTERKTGDGGTVAIYSDITDLKQREQDLTAKSNALEQLSNQLAKYLSPQIYDSIFSGKQEVKLVSQRKRLTVFFSDLVGFTSTTEKLESEDLTQLLNQYLTEMSQIALDHGATIDKYIGDAIVIFFGDPETLGVKEDALACVSMAIAMRKRMAELEKLWKESGLEEPLRCRMGINTGLCTVGNFGSDARMDYTIIGGGVNLAARLETACTPDEILISYETHAHVKDLVHCKEFDKISVKGFTKPIATYQVVDLHENLDKEDQAIRTELPHLKIDADVVLMSTKERQAAATALREAANRLWASET